jgi:hypothetical protein
MRFDLDFSGVMIAGLALVCAAGLASGVGLIYFALRPEKKEKKSGKNIVDISDWWTLHK